MKANEKELLKNRIAKCAYCNKKEKSISTLPFFEFLEGKEFDRFYCGCMGWD